MSSTRYSPWERATRGQAAAMAAALATQQMQQDQLAEFGGRVRHWEKTPQVVCGQLGFSPDGAQVRLGGFTVRKWAATDKPLEPEACEPNKAIVPIKVPYKRARSPTPDPDAVGGSSGRSGREKLPPRRSSRLNMSQGHLPLQEQQQPASASPAADAVLAGKTETAAAVPAVAAGEGGAAPLPQPDHQPKEQPQQQQQAGEAPTTEGMDIDGAENEGNAKKKEEGGAEVTTMTPTPTAAAEAAPAAAAATQGAEGAPAPGGEAPGADKEEAAEAPPAAG